MYPICLIPNKINGSNPITIPLTAQPLPRSISLFFLIVISEIIPIIILENDRRRDPSKVMPIIASITTFSFDPEKIDELRVDIIILKSNWIAENVKGNL